MIKKLLFGLIVLPLLGHGQFLQDFEGGTGIPTGWTVINGGDTNTWNILDLATAPISAHSGTKIATIAYSATAHADYLITPPITVTAGVSDYLSFWARSRDPLYAEFISVRLSTTGNAASDFTVILDANVAPPSGANFYKYFYDLSAYVGQTVYIGFYSSTTDRFAFDLDDVENKGFLPCQEPTLLTASNPLANSIDLAWTSTATAFEVQYGAPGFALGTGTTEPFAASSGTLSGLNPGSAYQYYVRANCGTDGYSHWAGPFSFRTPCVSVAAFPHTEGFEATTIPECWVNENVSGSASWTFVANNGNSSILPRTGARMAEFRTTTIGNKTKLVMRPLDLTGISSPELTFYYANVNWFGDIDELRVFYKTSLSGSWTQIGANYTAERTAWTQVTLALPNPSATYYIAFEATSNWARGLNLDDVSVNGVLSTKDFNAASLRLYPNPVRDVLNLSYDESISSVEVYNLLGQKLITKSINASTAQLDLSDLSAGNYLVRVFVNDKAETVKIIKQ